MNFAMGLTTPNPEGASTTNNRMDDDGDVLAAWPTPLVEVRPQMGYERHRGSGFELVLDVTVLRMGRELVEVPNVVSQVVEQNVDIPVRRGRGRSKIPRGGLLDLRPGQGLPAHSSAPVVEYFAPAPAVISPPELVIEYFSPAPAVFQAPAPSVEFFAPAPAVSEAPAPVTEYFLPGPAVFLAPAPVEEYSSPMPAVSHSPMRVGSVSCLSVSGGVWSSSVAPWYSGRCPTGGRALRAGRAPPPHSS